MSAIGMMNEGYFVGRKELTHWIKQMFDPGFSKVEDLASGVVYCQILNSIYPGSVPMTKVKVGARTEVDFIHNFKQLQSGFNKKKIDRFIDVDKLTKKSFQYNMEFLQFMKTYWDMHAPDAARTETEGVFKEAAANQPAQAAASSAVRKTAQPAASGASRPQPSGSAAPAPAAGSAGRRGPSAGVPSRSVDELQLEVTELKLSVENLERERDFYYQKLREVEVLCQTHEHQNVPFLQDVLAILYKMDDSDEFAPPEDA